MNADERACPFCAETIKAAAVFCKHCRNALTADKGGPVDGDSPLAIPESGPPILNSGEIADLLALLVDRSLVATDQISGRYRLLETVRQYAEGRLLESSEAVEFRNRHFECYCALAEAASPHLDSHDQLVWLDRLDDERDNLRSALNWSLSRPDGGAAGIYLGSMIWRYWNMRSLRTEGRAALAALLATPAGRELSTPVAVVTCAAGSLAWYQADCSSAESHARQSLEMFRKLGDRQGVAKALNSLGNACLSIGDQAGSAEFYRESLAIRREVEDWNGVAASLNNLGTLAAHYGDLLEARAYLEEGLALGRKLGNRWGIAIGLANLGSVERALGNLAEARSYFSECLQNGIELGWPAHPLLLEELVLLAETETRHELAAVLHGAAERAREVAEMPMSVSEQDRMAPRISNVRSFLGEEAFEAARKRGQEMDSETAARLILG